MRIPEITHFSPDPDTGLCLSCGQPSILHDGMQGLAVLCRVPTHAQATQTFYEITAEGVDRFGTRWLAVNTDVVRLARTYGLEPGDDVRLKAVLVTLALAICEAQEQEGER